jgi:hypothetical protein
LATALTSHRFAMGGDSFEVGEKLEPCPKYNSVGAGVADGLEACLSTA